MSHEKPNLQQPMTLAEKIRERHPEWPDLQLTFYFSPHGNYTDIEGIKPHLQEADILLYESAASSNRDVRERNDEIDFLNDISTNPITSYEEFTGDEDRDETVFGNRLENLWDSGTAVGVIDIGKSELEQRMVLRMTAVDYYIKPGQGNYEESLQNFLDQSDLFADLQAERERMMLGNFEKEIERILESRPDLQNNDELKILISMGSAHTTLRHRFTEAGFASDKHMSVKDTYVYDHGAELVRGLWYGRQPSEDLIKRAYTDYMIEGLYYAQPDVAASTPADDLITYRRRLISAMDEEQMEQVFNLWSDDGERTLDNVNEYLESQGLEQLPRNVEELALLNKAASEKPRRGLGGVAIS